MIPESMSLSATGAIANLGAQVIKIDNGRTNNMALEQNIHSQNTSTVSAINGNTFVVKLKPSVKSSASSPGNVPHNQKANLLQLFCGENGKRKNVSFVKALGIGRIVVNRSLLDKSKNNPKQTTFVTSSTPKPGSTRLVRPSKTTPISVSIPQPATGTGRIATIDGRTVRLSEGTSELRTFLRSQSQSLHVKQVVNEKENQNSEEGKYGDELGGNLVNFMNFKFSNLISKPLASTRAESSSLIGCNETPKLTLKTSLTHPLKPQNGNNALNAKDSDDDDLTSLSWLTGNDSSLKKTIRLCNPDDAGISMSGDESDEDAASIKSPGSNAVFTARSKVDGSSPTGYSPRKYDQPYNPNGKPPYSFSCLIFMAIEDSHAKKLPVKDIYGWVCKHFPYFLTAPPGWKNSIRHNLSLNKCFKKADQEKELQEPGKGAMWCIDPAYRPNLIQALKRTPFYPYLYPNGIGQPLSLNNLASLLPEVRSGRIPLWSPNFSATSDSAWADPDVASAALNLMGLKGSDAIDKQSPSVKSTIRELAKEILDQRKRNRKRTVSSSSQESIGTIPLVITDPSEDHTYSSASIAKSRDWLAAEISADERCFTPDSDKSAPDAAYEFETCGTDLESEAAEEELVGIDTDGDQDAPECDLGDSGFSSLKSERSRRTRSRTTTPPKQRRKGDVTPPATTGKRAKRSVANKSEKVDKKSLKVRFKYNKKNAASPQSAPRRGRKRKADDTKFDSYASSDADSGKDSPKVVKKSRSRVVNVKTSPDLNARKTKRAAPSPARRFTSSPYGTRSSTQLRQSKRIAASEQRRSSRRKRNDSSSNDLDDEEIKLAAGSLLHLAGFRSPAAGSSNGT